MLIKLLVLLVTLQSIVGQHEDSFGCGGFVKSLNDDQLDFSKVEIILYSKQGSLKDKTDCSPSNGYYFIPIYDKGEYLIKISAPHGWFFEPQQFALNFDGKTDICSLGKDVNFVFKGFGIAGKVNIFGGGYAKGVSVKLISGKSNEVIGNTVTDIAGVFSFTPISPGTYKIKVSHDSWHFSKPEHTVQVETGNTELKDNALQVSGFNVKGKVLSDGYSNLGFLLYNLKGQNILKNCNQKLPEVASQTISKIHESEPSCFVDAQANGEYAYSNISPGKYLVIPHFNDKSIKFHINPSHLEFTVEKDNIKIDESFEITGFTVNGKVLQSSADKKGVSGAEIKINGKVVTKTDANGVYVLDNIRSGTYTIQVSAPNLQFQDHTVKITFNSMAVPEIFVSGFKVCGKVISEKSYKVAVRKIGSTFYSEVESDASRSGEFCTYLGSGKYSFSVLISDNEKSSGIQFFPLQQNVEVVDGSVSDLVFSQLRAQLGGKIVCLENEGNACDSMEVSLVALDANGRQTSSQKVVASKGKYVFEEILPGSYLLSVSNQDLCWEKHQIKIDVKSAVETVQPFVQNGFKISMISSHTTNLSYKLRSETYVIEKKDFELTSGLNVFCVPKSGVYDISLKSCHTYDASVPKSFSTRNQSPITITAVKHRHGVRILSETALKYSIDVVRDSGIAEVIKLIEEPKKVDGYFSYRYDFDLKPQEKLKLLPKSSEMLFKPESAEISGSNECLDVAFNFIATKGLVIDGKTVPLIADVMVILSFPKNPDVTPLSTTTSASGEFHFGPIDPTMDIQLTAEKESYVFSEYNRATNSFAGHKLCEIIAFVKDEEGKPLSGVLLSLSGGENYRKNLVTGEDGKIKFHSLAPFEYYLRGMMKEYKFEPNSKIINVKNGETVQVELNGKRIAYSAFGQIQSLNGDPFGNVLVEAVATSETCSHHQEETQSDQYSGQFRIRGLMPNCQYSIRIKSGAENELVDRSLPKEKLVDVKEEDFNGLNFVGISPVNFCDVIAKIRAKSFEHYKSLKIHLYKKGSDTPEYSQRVELLMLPKSKFNSDVMVFFPRIPLDNKVYYIELTTTLSDKNYKYNMPSIQFVSNSSSFYAEIQFDPVLRAPESELNSNSLAALFLIFLVGFVFFKQELVFDMVGQLISQLNNKFNGVVTKQNKRTDNKSDNFIDEREIDRLAQDINAIKKKKSKKLN